MYACVMFDECVLFLCSVIGFSSVECELTYCIVVEIPLGSDFFFMNNMLLTNSHTESLTSTKYFCFLVLCSGYCCKDDESEENLLAPV